MLLTMASNKRPLPAGRRRTSARPTFRPPRNVVSRDGLRKELWPPSEAHVDFQYFDLMRQSSVESSPLHWQGMRKALVAGLRDHLQFVTRNMGRLREDAPGTALPHGMATALLQALEEVNDGEPAVLFMPKPQSGGRGNRRSPAKQASVDWAVRYLTAVRLGWIPADGARVRVAALYGVTVRQVERWLAAAGKARQRESKLRQWAASAGFRPFTDTEAGRALGRLLPAMAKRYRGTSTDQ